MATRTLVFFLLFGSITAGATYAGSIGVGAEATLLQQQGLRVAGGRLHRGGGLRGGK
jgi:hypothetical protein